jgi:hypothetical protein
MRRAWAAAILVLLSVVPAGAARAQRLDLQVRATRRDTLVARATVTAAFAVANRGGDIVHVTPRIVTPADWVVLMGQTPFAIGPGATEMLMLSVVVPARARAGDYTLRVSANASDPDSVVVRVPVRRALEVTLLDRPAYVVSGNPYTATFLVRNRGNFAVSVRVAGRSTLGRATLDTALRLDAEQSGVVRARVVTPAGLSAATDDVLEILAQANADSGAGVPAATEASARITVVPEPSRTIEEFLRLPTQVNLRAASSDAVSPFEIFGRGPLRDGGETQLDFLFRGPTGPFSAFGERDEYRVELRAPGWRARAGDNIYMLSPLTGGAQPGMGAGLEATRGAVTGGAYGQQFRRAPQKGTEAGAFLSARPRADVRVGLNLVGREGGVLPGNVASATTGYAGSLVDVDFELARSQSASGPGMARSGRLSGAGALLSYDIGHQFADTAFSGAQRGAEHTYVTASTQAFAPVSFSLAGGRHRSDLTRSTGVPYLEQLDVGTFGATLFSRYTIELGAVSRATAISGAEQQADQRSIRARGDQELAFGLLSLESEVGTASEPLSPSRTYSDVSLGVRRSFATGAVSLWTERYSGGSITKGSQGTITFGGDATLRLTRNTDFSIIGYGTRLRTPAGEWHSQVDGLVSRLLENGSRVSLRARLIGGGTLTASEQSVAFIEYGMPLRLPVARLRTPGRVYGRVVDAVTGRGVPGALVRLGPQVAITDRQGQVAFGGVPGGEHRLSMSQETSFADAVFIGDPTLMVDSARPQPTTFELAIARSARLDVSVRRFASARTGVAGAADSVVDAGALANATLVLASDRDTLYRTTRDDGQVTFTDVPPGRWVVSIRGDAPAFHRFDPDRVELTLAPGAAQTLSFRLVPRRREVQLIGGGQELRNEAADPKNQPPTPPSTRIRRPNDRS